MGPEDHHDPCRPRQPEQRGTPSLLAVMVVFYAVHSPLFQWDSLRHRLAGRGLPAGAEERQGGQVQEELPRGAQMGPSRLQALQLPDGPLGGWPQCLAGWPGQGLASLHYPRKVEAPSYLCFSPHPPSFRCLQGPGAALHPAAHLSAPGYHSRHHSGVSECSRPFSVPQLQLQSQCA